ncbi:DUF3793 family protein [Anaeromicrobium sediminis]|uniref:DUF3793 domain-containing protein n=1 Tax=Anaeromicrobium sediminis TaxID=1478221 RepID=A0A267MEQ2_9FIRM|nr:DUF3793 family protein [Anaeromicrobium sediminis]PAB58054.1 hypothetical protein CCE28_17105 [Anaeromicrobium sediminis]
MNEHKQCFKQNKDPFIQWLVGTLGPVILGVKPSEIMSFKMNDATTNEKIKKIEETFSICKHISYKISYYNGTSIKVLFYNVKSLEKTLKEPRNLKFLASIGYPKKFSLNFFLNHLISKINLGIIPTEIGVFLGYPLKDVIGFMGHPSLKLTKVNGWRIYGDSRISDQRYEEFLQAKKKIRDLLTINNPSTILAITS